jgi:hypothetical protein
MPVKRTPVIKGPATVIKYRGKKGAFDGSEVIRSVPPKKRTGHPQEIRKVIRK